MTVRKRKIRKISQKKKDFLLDYIKIYGEKHVQLMRCKLVWGYSIEESHLHALQYNKNLINNSFYLFFDFETSGCGPILNQDAIELAWTITDSKFNILKKCSYYFSEINDINVHFHGEDVVNKVKNCNNNNKLIIQSFIEDINYININKGYIIAHNISFDLKILQNECEKYNIFYNLNSINYICTMKKYIKLCNVKNKKDYIKYPKLSELYFKCFNENPNIILHQANNDVEVLLQCFKYLQKN
jgi:DNA polymerase III epsilon subunit-like protein